MGENYFAPIPVALYGTVILCSAIASNILTVSLISHHGKNSTLAIAFDRGIKGKISLGLYIVAIPLSFINSWLACAMYAMVSFLWLVPHRQIEQSLKSDDRDRV